MRHCESCEVDVRGRGARCPLCQTVLVSGKPDPHRMFPAIPPEYQRNLLIRVMIFISIAALVISFVLSRIVRFETELNWLMVVLLGIVSFWLLAFFLYRKRHNLAKSIVWQVLILSLLLVIWDRFTGWSAWSINYGIPILCTVALILLYVLVRALKRSARDYLVYLVLNSLIGLVPVLLSIPGWVTRPIPSWISFGTSLLFLAAILIFQGESILTELKKRMHV